MSDKLIERIKADREAGEYFIVKRGFYYRPDNCGYTDRPILAGLYSEADAIATTHPNGEDGPRDGMHYFHESKCRDADYLAFKEQQARILADDKIIKAAGELAEAVEHERNMPCQDIDMQMRASEAVDTSLAAYRAAVAEGRG